MQLSVLFDLDGTIVDSKPGIIASCEIALRSLGHEPNESLTAGAIIGPPVDEVMRTILAPLGDDRIEQAVTAYREHYGAIGLFDCSVYPGIIEAIDTLLALGAQLYVATSKRTGFARLMLQHLELIDRFTGVYGSEPGGKLDAKPELLSHVLRSETLEADRCLMIGDRDLDTRGAQASNITSIGVLWGYGTRSELEVAGADFIVSAPAELAPLVLKKLAAWGRN